MDLNGEGAEKKINLSERVKLNIGGLLFETTLATLVSHNGMLKRMFESDLGVKKDSDGSVFVDRDGDYFSEILNFLRNGSISLSRSEKEIEKILAEAKFYQIDPLICMLEEKLSLVEGREKNSNYQYLVFLSDFSKAHKASQMASKPAVLLHAGISAKDVLAVEWFQEVSKEYCGVFEFILCLDLLNRDYRTPAWTLYHGYEYQHFAGYVVSLSTCRAVLEAFAQNEAANQKALN